MTGKEKHREGVRSSWQKAKILAENVKPYSYQETRDILLRESYYKELEGKAKNRTLLKQDKRLYKSIYEYTGELERVFKEQKSYAAAYNFYKRVLFIAKRDCNVESLKCSCKKRYTWTEYCRFCPDYKRNQLNKAHTEETKRKMRIATLEYLKEQRGQLAPRYNRDSIQIIEKYGEDNGLIFMHAENGGEYYIKRLGYFVDAYDPVNNVVLEIDEKHHFNADGTLKEKDLERQSQIEKMLNCTFVRIRYDRD
jgi:hypothetical protein